MRSLFADALFWIALASCVIAQIALFRSIALTRAASRAEPGVPAKGAGAIEVVWVVVPAVALAVVLWFTWRAIHPAP